MNRSVVDLVTGRRVFGRFVASASAAAARALANGHTVAVWDDGQLLQQHTSGHREPIPQEVDDEAPKQA